MGEGEKRMCSENKNVRKIVIIYDDNSEKIEEFTDNLSAREYWHSIFSDLDNVKNIDYYQKLGNVYIKKIKYVTKTDTLKFL